MEILGWFLFLLVGVTLGLIGGGGSILTVPLLVYVFQLDISTATVYSLFIIGTSSLVGVIPKYLNRHVNFRAAVIFGLPSMISVFITRRFLLPEIPEVIFETVKFSVDKGSFLMIIFSVVMLLAAIPMIKTSDNGNKRLTENTSRSLVLNGLAVGLLTGLLGAGGGFLIIPALLLISELPVRMAIGTSLLIISANSFLGFFSGDINELNWQFLSIVTASAILGIFVGNKLSEKVQAQKLKKALGFLIVFVGISILISQLMVL